MDSKTSILIGDELDLSQDGQGLWLCFGFLERPGGDAQRLGGICSAMLFRCHEGKRIPEMTAYAALGGFVVDGGFRPAVMGDGRYLYAIHPTVRDLVLDNEHVCASVLKLHVEKGLPLDGVGDIKPYQHRRVDDDGSIVIMRHAALPEHGG